MVKNVEKWLITALLASDGFYASASFLAPKHKK
jgi:hypothetical protein